MWNDLCGCFLRHLQHIKSNLSTHKERVMILLRRSRSIGCWAAAAAIFYTTSSMAATIAGGDEYSIAKRADGTVVSWGANSNGSLGTGNSYSAYTPQVAKSFSGAVAVAAGGGHTLILKSDKTVWAWGNNYNGQLGVGNTTSSVLPAQVQYVQDITAVAAGEAHSLALKSDGTVWSWGKNSYGALALSNGDKSAPLQIAGLSGVAAIAAASNSSYALKSDGTVWAWGYNYNGELGNGSTTSSSVPVLVTGAVGIVAIAAGSGHVVALKQDGTVLTWGDNYYCQLGNNTTSNYGSTYCRDSTAASAVSGLSGVSAIAASSANSVALKSDGTVWVWGANTAGQLGNNSPRGNYFSPVQVTGLSAVSEIAGSRGDHLLARKTTGEVYAWGSNSYGQLGNSEGGYGSSYNYLFAAEPVRVVGLGGDGFLNLASSTSGAPSNTTTELCRGAASTTTALYVDFPCVSYNNVDYRLRLMLDPSITSGTYFKLLELNAR
jgi:alpha-tubulin suppressor-like RCC1 family protein